MNNNNNIKWRRKTQIKKEGNKVGGVVV